jgi:type VI secretion system secreted protein VgrG
MASSKIIVESPLGKDALMLRRMTGREELGRLSSFELDLLSTRRDVALKDVLGRDMTVHLDLPGDKVRHFHGYVSELAVTGGVGRHAQYRVTLRPWLWFLTRTSNSRIFQEMTVPDILKQMFRERGFTDFDDTLSGSYKPFEYVVQYRETDFNFVSRLMEQEGIYYFFRHEQGKHTLVLADGYGAHQPAPGYEEVPYYPPDPTARRERESLDDWQLEQHVQPGTYVLDDYDFKKPRADLAAKLSAPRAHEHDDYEMYDYPGKYREVGDGEGYVRVRLEELHADFERTAGAGNARGLAAGGLFSLVEYPRSDQNQEYLITATSYELTAGEHEAMGGGSDGEQVFRVALSAIKSTTPYRPARTTPRPVVHGPQTAKVVGKSGEEIWTDEHGRVKVRFHWDRGDTADENSSCWVRVSQTMAGAGWGAMHVPRIGQEVVVSFLEGDPDRPLVTGRVYNGANSPPFPLPGSAMVSGMKSDSTPGGGGYNEISLDDTKGNEKLTIHGQFDMATTVEHDQTLTVHNNRTSTIDVNDTESVGANQSISVGGDQSLTVTGSQTATIGVDQTLSVGSNQTVSVGSNQTVTIGSNAAETIAIAKALTIGAAYQVSVGGAMNETVGALKAEEVGGAKSVNVGVSSSENVAVNKSVNAGGNISESAGKKVSVSAGTDMSLAAKAKGVIDIGSELTIKVGGATITMKKSGDITIKGKKITIDASGDLVLKGSKIKEN